MASLPFEQKECHGSNRESAGENAHTEERNQGFNKSVFGQIVRIEQWICIFGEKIMNIGEMNLVRSSEFFPFLRCSGGKRTKRPTEIQLKLWRLNFNVFYMNVLSLLTDAIV